MLVLSALANSFDITLEIASSNNSEFLISGYFYNGDFRALVILRLYHFFIEYC